MARGASRIIHIGIKGTVIAVDRATGAVVWETKLKGSGFVNLVFDGDDLFATTRGEILCLDPVGGQIRWNNPLRGFGWGLVTVATADGSSVAAMEEHRRQEAANAAAASNSAA